MFRGVFVVATTAYKKGKIESMKTALLALLLFTVLPVQAGVNKDLRQGSKLYQKGKYGEAYSKFEQALREDPQNPAASFGAGAAAYYLKEYDQAAQAFSDTANQPGKLQQDAWFNLGNTYYRARNKEKAIASYKQAILQNPRDKEALHNLQLLLREQQNQQNKQDQNQQNQNQDSKNQDQQDQQNKGQAPEQSQSRQQDPTPQESQEQRAKQAADRVLQMARDSEYKKPNQPGQAQPEESVEKDW